MKKQIKSFKAAFSGISDFYRHHFHAQIELVCAAVAILLGFVLKLEAMEWCMVLLSIALVTTAEAINTSIEYLCDRITLEQDEQIGKTKDMAAGAVLMASIFALVVGLLIFGPKLLHLIGSLK